MNYNVCDGRPADLVEAVLCLDEISKNVKGELKLVDAQPHECPALKCRTLTTEHLLVLEIDSHSCDSAIGAQFDGRFASKDLTTVYVDGSGDRRGMHTGTFTWRSGAGLVVGKFAGMTNEGTHREPAFQGCQKCDQRGVMEGRLCGRLTRPADPAVAGAQVTAAYRFAFDADDVGGRGGGVVGTLEGLVVRPCGGTKQCATFTAVGSGPNPFVQGDLSIETSDLTGSTLTTSVVTWGTTTGLQLWHSSLITLAHPASRVEVTLVRFAQPAKATAFDTSGAAVAATAMTVGQQVPETLVLSGAGIVSVLVESPADEVLMPQICWEV